MENPTLKFYKIFQDAQIPKFATTGSACFDIHAYLPPSPDTGLLHIKECSGGNPWERVHQSVSGVITLFPNVRYLIPTGLIFDIPTGYSVRLHPRSGLSFKDGISLSNCEGIIDSDYVEQVFVSIIILDTAPRYIKNGDKICQGELIKNLEYNIEPTTTRPLNKTNRIGGFGSTGI